MKIHRVSRIRPRQLQLQSSASDEAAKTAREQDAPVEGVPTETTGKGTPPPPRNQYYEYRNRSEFRNRIVEYLASRMLSTSWRRDFC